MGFRKGKSIRDAIFQLSMISERVLQMDAEKEIQGKRKRRRAENYTFAAWIIRKHLIE